MVTMPSTTCGRASDQGLKPNTLAESAWGIRNPESLSRVIEDCGSNAPKKKAFQLSDMLRAAVA